MHEGHIHVAKLAQRELALDKVYFLPLNQAVHKNQPRLPAEKRLELLRGAIKPYDFMDICLADIERKGASYAVDTVEYLKTKSDFTGADLYYIIGADAFEHLFEWKEPERLLELVKFIIAARPGYDFSKVERMFANQADHLDKLFLLEDEGIAISSTQIMEGF